MFYGFAIVLKIRKQKTAKKIQKSAESDPLWNHNNLIDMVREVYPQIQEAWTMRELKNVAHLVTLSFIQKHQPILNGYKQRNIINVLDSITVEDIVITSIKDDNDNSKDLFKVYLKGKMRDFLTHEKGFTQLMNKQSNINNFEDLFIFVRNNNSWLLHDIINEPTGFDIR
jgi:predicted lipid-binding transport protein (Tim44 family)